VFSTDGQQLVCEYCASKERLAAASETGVSRPPNTDEQSFLVAMATSRGHLTPLATRTFSCQGCAARFVLPPQQLTLTCPYCDSTYVVENKETAELVAPVQVIPFAVNETQAKAAIRGWLQALKLETPVRVVGGLGLYLPAWSFDLGGQIRFRYEVKVQNDEWGRRAVGQERWEARTDEQLLYYNDLLVPATQRLPPPCDSMLDRYDKSGLVAYDPRYLADWPAETYQVELGDAALEARRLAFAAEQQRARHKLPFEQVRNLVFSSTGLIVESFKLVLVPAWLAHYELEGKRHDLIVNGQNGLVIGAQPSKGPAGWLNKLFK
jgi:DNA-directed RNA polymerase subunit RPC12/RpoP